jgi:hypothetical protein
MKTAATRTRTFPARPVTTVLLTCTIALVAWSATAQTPEVTEAEMHDLRAMAHAAETTAPPTGFTQAELRDLREDAKMLGSANGGGPAFHGLTADERADLRSEAMDAHQPTAHPIGFTGSELADLRSAARTSVHLVDTHGFSAEELSDLRAEARVVFPRSSGPVRAFTAAELRDLRGLAHDWQIARNAGILTRAR